MATWQKTKHVGVRFRESGSRRHRGRPEKYYSIRYKREGKTVEESVGWESSGITSQYCSNLRGKIVQNIKTGQGFVSIQEKRESGARKKQAEENRNISLQDAFDDFLATRTLKPRTVKDYTKFMDSVFSDWKEKPLIGISRDMVSKKHNVLGDSAGHAQANQAFRFLKSLLNYSIGKYEDADGSPLVKHNPIAILSQTRQWYKVNRRQTIIKNKDLPKWFNVVQNLSSEVVRDYLLTLLLCGLRRNEALTLEAKMVDLEERTISLLDTKNNKPFIIPIPNYLHGVLKTRLESNGEREHVFPSRLKGRHIKEPQSGINKVIEASKVEFCSHDLRRVFITTAESLDLSGFAVKRLVNHSIGSDVTSGYIASDVDRLRKPIQQIEDRILSLAGVRKPGKIVELKTG